MNGIYYTKSYFLFQLKTWFKKCLGYVGRNLTIGNDCIIGAGCHLTSTAPIEDGTCVYGKNCTRQKAFCKPSVSKNKFSLFLIQYFAFDKQ